MQGGERKAAVTMIALRFSRKLPITPAVKVSEAIAWLGSLLPSATRSRVKSNMETVLRYRGETPSAKDLRRVTRKAYASYGRYYAEAATLPGASRERILADSYWESGDGFLREAWQQGKGVVLAIPHIGSWEWGGSMLGLTMAPMVAVAEVVEPPSLFEWFKQTRERIGINVEPLDRNVSSRLMHHLRDGRIVGLLCDRDIKGDGIRVSLLGVNTTMPGGPALLALRTGAALMSAVVYSGPGNVHRSKLMAPIEVSRQGSLREDVARITQLIADQLSELIAEHPEQWHVFAESIGDRP